MLVFAGIAKKAWQWLRIAGGVPPRHWLINASLHAWKAELQEL